MLGIDAAHHDVIVLTAAVIESGGGLAGAIGLELLVAVEGDDADGFLLAVFQPEDLQEEAADLFEVADHVAAVALGGGGEEFEVSGGDAQPGVGRSSRGRKSEEENPGQRQRPVARRPPHVDECITGSAEPFSMAAT